MDIMQNSVTFFSTSEPNYTNLKTDPIKSKKNVVHYFVYKSHYFGNKRGLGRLGDPLGGPGAKGQNQ